MYSQVISEWSIVEEEKKKRKEIEVEEKIKRKMAKRAEMGDDYSDSDSEDILDVDEDR